MDIIQAILLGLVQGLTEFLPISSSGHLILVPILFGFEDQGLAMDAILHLATLLAIILFFRSDLLKLLKGLLGLEVDDDYKRLAWCIVVASFPAGIAGLTLADWIEANLRNATFVACNLIFWSLVFFVADRVARNKKNDPMEKMGWKPILFIGCAQALALLPGTSRSGITIAAGLFSKLSHTNAARFSFLLGAPIILAAGLLKTLSSIQAPEALLFSSMELFVAFTVAFLSGYLAIQLLLKIVAKVGLLPFIIYRIVLAVFILIFYSG